MRKYLLKRTWMMTAPQLDIVIKRMVENYKHIYGNAISQIILYGSYARGDFTEESDIDIVAIVRGDRFELQEKLKKVWDLSAEIGLENDVLISPTIIPYDEYFKYKNKLQYYQSIENEGIIIV